MLDVVGVGLLEVTTFLVRKNANFVGEITPADCKRGITLLFMIVLKTFCETIPLYGELHDPVPSTIATPAVRNGKGNAEANDHLRGLE
jgi:hypothetical protein